MALDYVTLELLRQNHPAWRLLCAEKKRRLGQYAVTWQDGKPVVKGEDAPGSNDNAQ